MAQWKEGIDSVAGSMEGGCWLSGGKVLTQWREGTDSVASQSFRRQNIPHPEVVCQAFVINLPLNNWPLVISSFLLKTHRNNRVLPKMDENNVVWRHRKPSVPETSDWELQAPGERFNFEFKQFCGIVAKKDSSALLIIFQWFSLLCQQGQNCPNPQSCKVLEFRDRVNLTQRTLPYFEVSFF